MPLVRNLMTRNPNTVHPNMSLLQVLELMNEVACRHLPVLENGMLVGIITDRDLRLAVNVPAFNLALEHQPDLDAMEVGEFMTVDPYSIEPDATVQEAAKLLNQHAIGSLPVLENGSLVGILTDYDVLAYVARMPDLVLRA